VWAPGAFEIPLLAKLVAEKKKYNAILALGVVLQGATAHADLIGRAVTDSLQRISLEYSVPVINEVLLLQNEDQARQRCLELELNRGIEAARAAVSSARTVREIVSKL
jgi:6,7-dimethyl-8-ribityllumazine synthase